METSRSCTPTPPRCRAGGARWARARCRSAAARCTRRARRCSRRPSSSPRTCSRPNPDDIVVDDGGARRRRRAREHAGVGRARAAAVTDPARRPADMEPDARGTSSTSTRARSTFPFGAHVAVVEVDAETGEVELLRHIAVDDCGAILNPLLVAGQQHGGIAPGRRAGAVRRGASTTTTATRSPRTSWTTRCRSAAELPTSRRRNTETPTPAQPARREGHRRVGHDRLDAGGAQRGRRRAVAPRRPPHRHAAHAGAGLAGGRGGTRLTMRRITAPHHAPSLG